MYIQKIDWRKLAVMLLPIRLRSPRLAAMVRVLSQPLAELSDKREERRETILFGLRHTGQTCYLRHALNAQFGLERGQGFEIEDVRAEGDFLTLYDEESNQTGLIPVACGETVIATGKEGCAFLTVWDESTVWPTTDFIVWCPAQIYDDRNRLAIARSVVEKYRLLSRCPEYRKLNK